MDWLDNFNIQGKGKHPVHGSLTKLNRAGNTNSKCDQYIFSYYILLLFRLLIRQDSIVFIYFNFEN